MIRAIIRSMRPGQWVKNLIVFAGLLFTLDRPHPATDYAMVVLAFVLFCILSGVVYLINDVRDADRDRKHPSKSQRPVAAGKLSPRAALTAAVVLAAVGLGGSFATSIKFGGIALLYVALMTVYSVSLKNAVILDVMTIAVGFVLRAVAGAAVIAVEISPWLLVCTILMALFLGLAKRHGELAELGEDAASHRSSLGQYTVPLLDQLINVTASASIIAYALYTFFSKTGSSHPYMMATLPFVIYGVFRYLMLVHKGNGAANPEALLLRDKPLLADIGLWAIACALVMALS